jgi:RHS repeat-associated protein
VVARRSLLVPLPTLVVFLSTVLAGAHLAAQVRVGPKGGSLEVPANSTNQTASFTLWGLLTGAEPLNARTAMQSDGPHANCLYINPTNYNERVTPKGTPVQWPQNTSGHTATFTVKNTGACADDFGFTCTTTGTVTCTAVSPAYATLLNGATQTVTVTYQVGGVGTGAVKLTSGAGTGQEVDSGYYNITIGSPPGSPLVDASPYAFDVQDYHRCAQSCFAAMTSRATVPYFSLDAPRQVFLVYNGDRVNPHPFVFVNVSPDLNYGSWPSQYQLQVQVNGAFVTFVNGEQLMKFSYPGTTAPVRIAGQLDASTYATGVYKLDFLVSAYFSSTGSVITTDVTSKLVVVREDTSAVARGWSFGGIQRLYPQTDGSALAVDGDGSAVYFSASAGQTPFTSPLGEFSRLWYNGTTWWRYYPDSTYVFFDNTGRMVQVRDRFGNSSRVAYDATGRVVKITDPVGLGDTLTYGSNGLATVTDPGGRATTTTVDASRRLTTIQDPDNGTTQYGYDAQLRLSTITDRRQATTRLGYDAQSGLLDSAIAPSVTFFDNTAGPPVGLLAAWQKVAVPYGPTSPTAFTPVSPDSVTATVTEPGGGVTRFSVSKWGTPVRVTDASGRVTSLTLDSNGLPIKAVYATGRVDSTAYNASGLPVFKKAGSDSAIYIHYSGWALPDSIWGKGRHRVRNFIGPNGRVDSTMVGTSISRFTYDSAGRVRSSTDPQGNLIVSRLYASTLGNVSRDSLSNGQVRAYLYDQFGRDTAVQITSAPVRRTHFDLLNRPTQLYDGVHGTPTTLAYDAVLDTMVTDVQGQVYRWTYNALGWRTQRTDPAGHAEVYGYSRDGDLMRRTNRRGQTISYTYDALHRVTSDSGTNKAAEHWTYASNGLLMTSTSVVATETAYLNVVGRPDSMSTALAGQTFWRRYHYTVAGLLDSMAVSGGGIPFRARSFAYDTVTWALKSIRLGPAGTPATTITRNATMMDTSRTLPGGDAVSRQYDPSRQVGSISSDAGYGSTVNRQAQYDALNRRVFQLLGDGRTGNKYVYDSLGRLVADSVMQAPPGNTCPGHPIIGPNGSNCVASMQWTALSGTTYSYDPLGNRLDNGGAYGTGDRITGFAGCSYGTDADGDVVSRICGTQTVTFNWTADARLDTAIVGGTTVGFWYDAAGRLVRKDVNGAPQGYFLWDGANLLAELSGSATSEVAEYSYYSVDRLHAIVVGGRAYYAHTDVLGNVVALTDSTKLPQRSYKYDAWGALIGGTDNLPFGNADRPRWKAALWLGPELDLYYLRSRWYEPQTGRFLSEDPAGLGGGTNPYLFAGDDPINGSDPYGLAPACLDNPGRFGHCGGNSSGMDDREWDPQAYNDPAWDNFGRLSTGGSAGNPFSLACIGNADCTPNPGYLDAVYRCVTNPSCQGLGPIRFTGRGYVVASPVGGILDEWGDVYLGNLHIGTYETTGFALGFNAGFSFSINGVSDNLNAFGGHSSGWCGSLFLSTRCSTSNASGQTVSYSIGFGIPGAFYIWQTTVFTFDPEIQGLIR